MKHGCVCFQLKNITKLNYKRPPYRRKNLQCAEYNGNLLAASRSIFGCQDRRTLRKTQHERDQHKTKVRAQWYIFQAHERICSGITKETWLSCRMGAEGEQKPNQPIQSCQRNRFGPIKGERKKHIFYELISSWFSEVVQKQNKRAHE